MFLHTSWVFQIKPFFEKSPHRKKSGGVRSGDRGGQRPRPTMRSPKNFCSRAVIVFTCGPSPHHAATSNPSSVITVRGRTCFLSQTLPVPRNVVTSRYIVVHSLSGYALLKASPTAANDFYAKLCSIMSTRSSHKHTMFTPA
jgi:hypothetical protein